MGRPVKPSGAPAAGRFQPARGARVGVLEHLACDEPVCVEDAAEGASLMVSDHFGVLAEVAFPT